MEFLGTLSKLAGDFSFLFIFLGFSLAMGFFFGRTKLIAIMIDIFIARALVAVIPQGWISSVEYGDTIIFLLAFIFLLLTDHRLFDLHLSSRASGFFWRVAIMGILVTGMIASSLFSYLPEELVLDYVSKTLYSYFVSDVAQVFWMLAPLGMLAFINHRLKD